MALGVPLRGIGASEDTSIVSDDKIRDEPLLTCLLVAEPCFWTFSLTELAASLRNS